MKKQVTIVDYGMGNLFSIQRAIEYVGGIPVLTDDPDRVSQADRLLLPGVGAFGEGMSELINRDLSDGIRSFVETGKPLLGICLGMQLLFSESHEFGIHKGLNLIPGKVLPFTPPVEGGGSFKIPHIGWNKVWINISNKLSCLYEARQQNGSILEGLTKNTFFYFVHSFICVPDDPNYIVAKSVYGLDRFCSIVGNENLWGCQFHPEKSGESGLIIYRNFLNDRLLNC